MEQPTPDPRQEIRNGLLKATPEQLRHIQQRYDPVAWAVHNARISLAKGPLTFVGREFMVPVYRDLHNEIVIIKGAQMGFSTMSIIRSLWAATTFPMSVIYCVDDQTEVLSRQGWKGVDDLQVGEDILTFDREHDVSRWSPVQAMNVDRDYRGPMVHMKNRQFDALVTPGHNWFVMPVHGSKWHTYATTDIPPHQLIPLAAPFVDETGTSPYSDDFVELAAWTITEGHYRHYYPGETSIVITQNEGAMADRIRELLGRTDIVSRRGVAGAVERRDGRRLTFRFDGPCAQTLRDVFPTKELTPDFVASLPRRQLDILVSTMLDGDGDRAGRMMLHQKSKQTSDAFAMAAVLLGYAVSLRERDRAGFSWWETRIRKGSAAKTHRIVHTRIDIAGTIWCPTTRDGTALFRRNGTVWYSEQSFPTKGDVSTFTAARINPIIASSLFLSDRIQDFDSVGMKQFARVPKQEQRRLQSLGEQVSYSTIYFNGAQNPKDATSVNADLLIHDEEDRSDPQTIEEYQSRLYASRFKWLIRLSTPTFPGAGIDRQWRRSDMRHWMIQCSGCNERFEMDYPRNIEPESYKEVLAGTPARYKCHKCNKTISEAERVKGVWVAERPTVPVHGYSISQMSASWVSANTILDQYDRATFKGAFWNLVMAKPYQEGTSAMTREAILARQDENVVGVGNVWERMEDGARGLGCTMGVDVGHTLDVVIGTMERGRPRTIEFKRLTGDGRWDELNHLMTLYGIVNCVIDADPEDHMAHVFANKWPGRVWRCRYSHGRVKEIKWDDKTYQVTPPRTEILTKSSMELLTERILPKYDGTIVYDEYIKHHENSKKVPIFSGIESVDFDESVDKEQGIRYYEWRETGPDHMFHSGTYEMLARMGYQGSVGLPSIGLVTIDRSKTQKAAEPVVARNPIAPPLLLPTGMRRARRRMN